MSINVSRVVEVNVELTLNEAEAEYLLHFLKSGVTPLRAPSNTPTPSIVRDLAIALINAGVK